MFRKLGWRVLVDHLIDVVQMHWLLRLLLGPGRAEGLSFPHDRSGWRMPVRDGDLLALGTNHPQTHRIPASHGALHGGVSIGSLPGQGRTFPVSLRRGSLGDGTSEVGGHWEIRGLPIVNPVTVVWGMEEEERRRGMAGAK